MTRRIGGIVIAAMLSTAWIGGCGDDKDKKAADGAAAAAKPAVAADAKPKEVALAWASALAAGDAAAARSHTTGTEDQMQMVEHMAGVIGTQKSFQAALKEKFGADAVKSADGEMNADEMRKEVEATEEKIDGDTATLTSKDQPTPLVLKKIDGRWKIDLSSAPMPPSEMAAKQFAAMKKAAEETIVEIKAGKFKSADEAHAAMGMKMMANSQGGEGLPTPPIPPAKPE